MNKVLHIQDGRAGEYFAYVFHNAQGWHWECILCGACSKPKCAYDFVSGAAKNLFAHFELKHPEKLRE